MEKLFLISLVTTAVYVTYTAFMGKFNTKLYLLFILATIGIGLIVIGQSL